MKKEFSESDTKALIESLKKSPADARVDAADRAMIDYAIKLTQSPGSVDEGDVGRLRKNGFDDLAIHDLASVVAYFAFVNRIADGLGVELESE